MGLGDSLNNLATGYQRGQAQYAANEAARQKQAEAAAKAAQDAAEFRLKLAQHSQTLTNSAEDEWNAIMNEVTSDNWDPAKLPMILPRVANFQKTYGSVWGGGDAMETFRKALHLDRGGQMEPGQQGPADPNAPLGELAGFLSPEQKYAADEKAMKARSNEAARAFTVQAMEYVREKGGGLPDEATFYKRIYDFQEKIQQSGNYDPKIIDDAMDIIRENAAGYYKGLAAELERATGQTGLSDKIQSRIDQVSKESSAWIKSLLLMDAQGNALGGDLFAERSPLQLEMERTAQSFAAQGMSIGQIKSNLIFKYRDSLGGLNLDVKSTPYAGSLDLMGASKEVQNAINRYYDTNEDPNEDQTAPMMRDDGTWWIVNLITGEGKEIYRPIPTPETPSVVTGQDTPYPKVPAQSNIARTSGQRAAPQAAPAREVSIHIRDSGAERAAAAEASSAQRASRKAEDDARKAERKRAASEKQAADNRQKEQADRNNAAFRMYRNGEITEEQFKEELRRVKAGEPSLFGETR